MKPKILVAKNLIESKHDRLSQKMDMLYNTLKMLSLTNQVELLQTIREEYQPIYEKLLQTVKYEKYKKLESNTQKKLEKVQEALGQYAYQTKQEWENVVKKMINTIKESENYQNFMQMDIVRQQVKGLQELLKCYALYISEIELQNIEQVIYEFKFDILFRKQVENLILGKQDNNALRQYDTDVEKEIFKKLLEEKQNALIIGWNKNSAENDEIVRIEIEEIMKSSQLLNRLILVDMKTHPMQYLGVLQAKIFNPHLCNIRGNIHMLNWWANKNESLSFSLLYQFLKYHIREEDTSIIECQNIFRKFQFECMPICMNAGQEFVYTFFYYVVNKYGYEQISNQTNIFDKEEQELYCKMDFTLQSEFGSVEYEFNRYQYEELLDKYPCQKEQENEKKEENQTITDKELMALGNSRLKEIIEKESIQPLKLEERKEKLKIRYELMRKELKKNTNRWRMQPLEEMEMPEKTFFTYIGDLFNSEESIEKLRQTYQKDFDNLNMHVKFFREKRGVGLSATLRICIAIPLADIADLPIDKEKLEIITKEEIEQKEEIAQLAEREGAKEIAKIFQEVRERT